MGKKKGLIFHEAPISTDNFCHMQLATLALIFAAMSQNLVLHRNHLAETLYVHDCLLKDLRREHSRLYDPKDSCEKTRERQQTHFKDKEVITIAAVAFSCSKKSAFPHRRR